MRIYNEDTDQKADRVTIYLTLDEAKEMKAALEAILKDPKKHHHEHVPDNDFKKEITVCIYREDDLSRFDERSKKLILYDY